MSSDKKNKIEKIIINSINNMNLSFNTNYSFKLSHDFLGKNRKLDSEQIVFLILDIEKQLSNKLDLTSIIFENDNILDTFENLRDIILKN